jgi:hypothetical protein
MTLVDEPLEYPLKTWAQLDPNFALQSDQEALFIDGIGPIAQYHCYCEMLWSHGVVYFLRDSLSRQIDLKIKRGVLLCELRTEIRRLETLNSDILIHEATQYANHPSA